MTSRTWVKLLLFNAVLAGVIHSAAPAQPKLSDRAEYDYNSTRPLAPNCPYTIYCYRVLVPMLLAHVPLEPEVRWRGLQWLAHTGTGTVVAVVSGAAGSPWIASVLLQCSYGFAFTAYDPYTSDPVVFLVAALILYFWIHNRPLIVTLLSIVFIFAKETVALIATVPAIAATLFRDRPARWHWLVPAALAWITLLSFHWYMDSYANWGTARNPAASFSTGSWLAIWWQNNPSLLRKGVMLFSPFGFAWAFAGLGYRHAPPPIRQLTLAAALPLLALVYVQTPERALSNAFFVIVPLAAAFLARVPPVAAWTAAITSGLVTARMGLSTEFLPPASVLLIPATLAAVWVVAAYWREAR